MASSLFRRDGALGDGKWMLWGFGISTITLLAFRIPELMTGVLPGLDDMMRLQQVRDLLAGQAWLNVDQSRLLTPEGGNMHWSRLPDLFLAGFILIARPLIGQSAAEALAVGVWPLILLSSAIALLCTIMQRLGVSRAGQVCALFFFAGSAAFFNFWPGRIDHHGLVAVLILAGLAALVSKQYSARSGVILAVCLCAALSIAIEALPYAAGLIAILGLFWIVRGHLEGVRVATFGLALMVSASLFFVFDAPGFSDRRMVCDAYGTSHWAALSFGGVLLTGLGVFGGWLNTWPKRVLVGGLAASLTAAVFVAVNPACFGDPYAAVPESVRESWLNAVEEAQSLPHLLQHDLERVVSTYVFLLMASGASIWMILKAEPEHRLSRMGVSLLLALAILATVWQLRGHSFSHLFALISAGWLAGRFFKTWYEKRGPGPLLAFAVAAILLSPMLWRNLPAWIGPEDQTVGEPESRSMECMAPENYRAMAAMPNMRIHTPIDLGIPVLLRTPHQVFVGPYHRNVLGIDRANTVLMGDPELAQQRLLDMGATHLAYCIGLGETNLYARRWPDSFAAHMNRGDVPDWLVPVDDLTETDGTVRLYRVTPE